MTGFVDATPDTGSEQDPVALIERQLEREEGPPPKPRDQAGKFTAQQPDPEPQPDEEEELPVPEPGPGEDPADDDGEDGDQEESDEQPSETFTVRANGKDIQVTREELLKGYSREADYRQKTMDLAATRQAVEAENQRIAQERQHYTQQLDTVASILQAQLPAPPDPAKLNTDPFGYVQEKENYELRVNQLRSVLAERQKADAANQQYFQQVQQQSLAQARDRLLEAMPEWKKPEVARKEQRQVADYLRTVGYADAEISQAADPRAIVMAKKAMLYDRLQADRPKIEQRVGAAPKMVRPGSSGPAPDKSKTLVKQIRAGGGKDLDQIARLIEMG
jgi:hypothetical protein